MNHRLRWIQYIGIVLEWTSTLGPWTRDHFFCQFWKLGFFLVSECEVFAHGGQHRIFLNHEHVATIPTCNMPKHTCMTHRNPILMHSFYSMP